VKEVRFDSENKIITKKPAGTQVSHPFTTLVELSYFSLASTTFSKLNVTEAPERYR
jgi:hypothetical protein